MKILKLIRTKLGGDYDYKIVVDKIPTMIYKKIKGDYIGKTVNDKGDIIFSQYLKYNSWGNAFAGRELELELENNKKVTIKDYWYDCGHYQEHGEFISIGIGTIENLKKCYVYTSRNINKDTFIKMLEEYLKHEKVYGYGEVEKIIKMDYEWYQVKVGCKKIPFMMNKYGNMVDMWTKEMVYPRHNVCKIINGDFKEIHYFKFEYKDENNNLIKLHYNYLQVLKDTLPQPEGDIIRNCNL